MYDDEPMRICQPCRRILRVTEFGTNRERIPDKVCKECKLTERQKLLASIAFKCLFGAVLAGFMTATVAGFWTIAIG